MTQMDGSHYIRYLHDSITGTKILTNLCLHVWDWASGNKQLSTMVYYPLDHYKDSGKSFQVDGRPYLWEWESTDTKTKSNGRGHSEDGCRLSKTTGNVLTDNGKLLTALLLTDEETFWAENSNGKMVCSGKHMSVFGVRTVRNKNSCLTDVDSSVAVILQ